MANIEGDEDFLLSPEERLKRAALSGRAPSRDELSEHIRELFGDNIVFSTGLSTERELDQGPFAEISRRLADAAYQDYSDEMWTGVERMLSDPGRPTDREMTILRKLHGLEDGRVRSYDEVAAEMGFKVRTIRRIERRAIQKLGEVSAKHTTL